MVLVRNHGVDKKSLDTGLVEHAKYGSKQSAKWLLIRYNWLWMHIVSFVISYISRHPNIKKTERGRLT